MTDPEARTGAVLAVEGRMTEEEREEFLARMTWRNPHLRGAHVADILDMLYESDAYLGIVEPFFEDNEHLWREMEERGDRLAGWSLTYAVIAAVVLLGLEEAASEPPHKTPPDEMMPLVLRLAGQENDGAA